MPTIPDRQDLDGSNAARNTVGIFQAGMGQLYDLIRTTLGVGGSTALQTKLAAQQALGVGGRNKIINGNFAINQRNVSGTVSLGAGQYGHDRWKAGASGCTYTIGTDGVDTNLNILSGSLIQVIEPSSIEAGTYCVSWEGSAGLLAGGSAYASPYLIPNVPTNPSGGFYIELGVGTLGKVQLENAGAPTPFERRSLDDETRRCRYFFRADVIGCLGQVSAGLPMGGVLTFDEPMRVTPTMGWVGNLLSASFYGGPPSYDTVTRYGFRHYRIADGTQAAGSYIDSITCSAEL